MARRHRRQGQSRSAARGNRDARNRPGAESSSRGRAQVKANLDLAKTRPIAGHLLLKDKAVAQQEVDEKNGALEARKADLAAAQASVERLAGTQQFQHIVAPFDGIVTARNVEAGWFHAGSSGPNQPLFQVAKTHTLRLYVNVPQSHTRLDSARHAADILFAEVPGKAFPGKVLRFSGALDPQSKTLLTELQVANTDRKLFPGMYAEIKFAFPQDGRTLLVPGNTIIVQSDGPKVLTVDTKQTIRTRQVKLGRDLGDKVEILSGLDPAEPLVANPSDSLGEGVEVKVQAQPSKS